MLRKKGIVRKTFLFSALLITLVTLISFLILYFAMPWFYKYKKTQTFEKNLDALVASLQEVQAQNEYEEIISNFCDSNNANVVSFDANDDVLPTLSTPFVSMNKNNAYVNFTLDGGKSTYSVIVRHDRIENGVAIESDSPNEQKISLRSFASAYGGVITLRGNVKTPVIDYVIASGTLQPIDEAKGVILSLIPYVLFMGITLGFLLAWIYARQISKPILKLSDAAVKMQRMEPDAKSGIHSDDELGLLSGNLDTLYASLLEHIDSLKSEMDNVNRLERSKTEMMQSASHELKTPVAALGGMLDGMIDNVGAYKNRDKYLLECKGQVARLSLLVSEILNASKTDISANEPVLEDTDLDVLVTRSFEEFDAEIRQKDLRVTKTLAPVVITTDASAFYRVLTNLTGNAVRYTPTGGEVVAVLESGLLSVENRCDKIPEDELSKLFEPFYTRSYNRDKSESGTGLGLYIVKRNLERLGIPYEAQATELGLKISLKL